MKDDKQKPRDRIVTVAAKLFYDHGINSVGVDKVSAEADVSKRTLYKYFPSKDSLVAAAMSELGEAWFTACVGSSSADPKERIAHVFRMVEPMAEKPDFYGCILMNTSIELRGTDATAATVVREFKAKLYEYFRQQAVLLGHEEPGMLAEQLIMLYDGCSAWIVMRRTFPVSTFRTLSLLLAE